MVGGRGGGGDGLTVGMGDNEVTSVCHNQIFVLSGKVESQP